MIVTTPQEAAQKVARRSAQMADKVSLEIAGVIENMSGFTTPDGQRFYLGEGGGQLLADELDAAGQGAAEMALRENAGRGRAADRGRRRRPRRRPCARPRAG